MEMMVTGTTWDGEHNTVAVEVEITRTIAVDQLYKIGPTEAYLGIEAGTVRITHIAELLDLIDIDEDLSSQADEFTRIHLDGMSDEYIRIEDKRLRNEPWVVYQYSRLPQDRYVLPLEEFVLHTTSY